MRAYRSCASARCGWRARPVSATRCAASSCRLRRSSSPSRRNTRLSGSCASWDVSVLTSSAMQPGPGSGERLRRLFRPSHVVQLRELGLRAGGEPLPLIPLLHRLRESSRRNQRVPEDAVRRDEQRVESQGPPQLLHRRGAAPSREIDATEQQMHRRIVRMYRAGLLGRIDLADRKSTRLNSSHANISYAVFCLKKKKKIKKNNKHKNIT